MNSSTKFDRKLKKLKWTVKDKGTIKVASQGKGARGSLHISDENLNPYVEC